MKLFMKIIIGIITLNIIFALLFVSFIYPGFIKNYSVKKDLKEYVETYVDNRDTVKYGSIEQYAYGFELFPTEWELEYESEEGFHWDISMSKKNKEIENFNDEYVYSYYEFLFFKDINDYLDKKNIDNITVDYNGFIEFDYVLNKNETLQQYVYNNQDSFVKDIESIDINLFLGRSLYDENIHKEDILKVIPVYKEVQKKYPNNQINVYVLFEENDDDFKLTNIEDYLTEESILDLYEMEREKQIALRYVISKKYNNATYNFKVKEQIKTEDNQKKFIVQNKLYTDEEDTIEFYVVVDGYEIVESNYAEQYLKYKLIDDFKYFEDNDSKLIKINDIVFNDYIDEDSQRVVNDEFLFELNKQTNRTYLKNYIDERYSFILRDLIQSIELETNSDANFNQLYDLVDTDIELKIKKID